jgi:hypothetical protein
MSLWPLGHKGWPDILHILSIRYGLIYKELVKKCGLVGSVESAVGYLLDGAIVSVPAAFNVPSGSIL